MAKVFVAVECLFESPPTPAYAQRLKEAASAKGWTAGPSINLFSTEVTSDAETAKETDTRLVTLLVSKAATDLMEATGIKFKVKLRLSPTPIKFVRPN